MKTYYTTFCFKCAEEGSEYGPSNVFADPDRRDVWARKHEIYTPGHTVVCTKVHPA